MNNPQKAADYRKKWKTKNADKVREYRRKRAIEKGSDYKRAQMLCKYWPGLSPEEAQSMYQELYAKQEGKCAICKTHQDRVSRPLCVDHCHETYQVRGLLCGNCNTGIGKLGDTYQDLVQAAKYLWAFEQQLKEA